MAVFSFITIPTESLHPRSDVKSHRFWFQLTAEDEERRRRRRERNKIAATKCRLKKRERTVNLVQVGCGKSLL
jgi:hypothetical protein